MSIRSSTAPAVIDPLRHRSGAATADADPEDWPRLAACRDKSQYFYDDGDQLVAHQRRETRARARALCARCPVRAQCTAYALRLREPHGIWGGFTVSERRRLEAIGWEDLADRDRGRVDVAALARRLRRSLPPPTEPVTNGGWPDTATVGVVATAERSPLARRDQP